MLFNLELSFADLDYEKIDDIRNSFSFSLWLVEELEQDLAQLLFPLSNAHAHHVVINRSSAGCRTEVNWCTGAGGGAVGRYTGQSLHRTRD